MPQKIQLFIADDHQILIDGLLAFFKEQPSYEVVGAATNGYLVLEALATVSPDMVLMDLNMPRLDGLATLERISKDFPSVRVIILSNYHQSELIKECKEKGAWGYLVKEGSKEELLNVLHDVWLGKKHFPAIDMQSDEAPSLFGDDFQKRYQLTQRELEIIKLVCKEYNTRTIAEALFISEFTVSTHRKNIMRKLNVKNIVGVINFAREHQLC